MNHYTKKSLRPYGRSSWLIGVFLYVCCTATSAGVKATVPDYRKQVKKTADSLISLNTRNDATVYYSLVLDKLFARAIQISHQEIKRHKRSMGDKISQKVLSTLTVMRSSLIIDPSARKRATPLTHEFKETVIASLKNFTRYQMPSAYDQHKRYLWVMVQVLENVNQINLGYKYAGIPEEEQQVVLGRLRMQQELIQEIRSILA
jgi:hypothetical protein